MKRKTCKNGSTFSSNSTDCFVFDGIDYCLTWRDSHVDISFITPTGRTSTIANSGESKASSVRRTATLRPSMEMGQQFKTFAPSNGNNTKKNTVDEPPSYPAIQSISSNRTMSSTSVGNESSVHSVTTTVENTQQQHQLIQKTMASLQKCSKRSSDLRIFIVWLERLEDMANFPIAEMFPFTTFEFNKNSTLINSSITQQQQQTIDHLIFYIYPFERGLRRIQIDGIWTKQGKPGPLHNGTVVSTRALPSLLKQTICNIARRKVVEIDNYQMTHLKRKQAISEFGRRFATRQDYSEFVEHLLQDNSASFGTMFPP